MKKQHGFTLIELVMVIVILGILAATALPKFADLKGDAREASINAAAGAMKSAMAIVHAQYLIGNNDASVSLEGTTINVIHGYPSEGDIDEAAGLSSNDYDISAGKIEIKNTSNCYVQYIQALNADTAARVNDPVITDC